MSALSPVILRSGATKNLNASTSNIRRVVVGAGVVRSFAPLRMTRETAQDDRVESCVALCKKTNHPHGWFVQAYVYYI